MKLLLISNSTNAGEEYLRYPLPEIGRFLDGVREAVFVPYAAVTFSYAEYEKKVQARFAELGIRVRSVHRAKDPAALTPTTSTPTPRDTRARRASSAFWSTSKPIRAAGWPDCAKGACCGWRTGNWS